MADLVGLTRGGCKKKYFTEATFTFVWTYWTETPLLSVTSVAVLALLKLRDLRLSSMHGEAFSATN